MGPKQPLIGLFVVEKSQLKGIRPSANGAAEQPLPLSPARAWLPPSARAWAPARVARGNICDVDKSCWAKQMESGFVYVTFTVPLPGGSAAGRERGSAGWGRVLRARLRTSRKEGSKVCAGPAAKEGLSTPATSLKSMKKGGEKKKKKN